VAAVTDLSDMVNRLTGGNSGTPENIWFFKSARIAGAAATAPIAGRPQSLWKFDGFPGPGSNPTTVAIPDNTTQGGLLQTDPGGGREKWLVNFFATGLVAGTVILYDRILHIGGLSGTTTTAQTVGGTLTRYTDGKGNFAFAEIYTAVGATATTIKLSSYTDDAGNASQVGPLVVFGGTGFNEATRAVFLPVAAGDNGIQAIASVQVTATTATAGNFGVTIGHPLAYAVIDAAGVGGWRDFTTGMPGLPEVQTDACLAMLWIPNTTTAPEITGAVSFIEA
jgi:hypothetical protein